MRTTDLAMLIKAHEFRNQEFEYALYDVIDKAAPWEQETKAHVYAALVESAQPHTTVAGLEKIIDTALNGYHRG